MFICLSGLCRYTVCSSLFSSTAFSAVTFPDFITKSALANCIDDARDQEDTAFTTDDAHTAHLRPCDPSMPANSVRNYKMSTKVAAIAFDELPPESELAALYQHPALRQVVAEIVHNNNGTNSSSAAPALYLSNDPVGRCYINVFRPDHQLSFHFDESEFSTTLMLQEASEPNSGLFQYTHPFKQSCNEDENDMVLDKVASVLKKYDERAQNVDFCETGRTTMATPKLHTLDFVPGTLSIFSGSKSLHRVTQVKGDCSRLVAVLTFAPQPGFVNSPEVHEIFFGRSAKKD